MIAVTLTLFCSFLTNSVVAVPTSAKCWRISPNDVVTDAVCFANITFFSDVGCSKRITGGKPFAEYLDNEACEWSYQNGQKADDFFTSKSPYDDTRSNGACGCAKAKRPEQNFGIGKRWDSPVQVRCVQALERKSHPAPGWASKSWSVQTCDNNNVVVVAKSPDFGKVVFGKVVTTSTTTTTTPTTTTSTTTVASSVTYSGLCDRPDHKKDFYLKANPGDEVQIEFSTTYNNGLGQNVHEPAKGYVGICITDSPSRTSPNTCTFYFHGTPAKGIKIPVTVGENKQGVYVFLEVLENEFPTTNFHPSWAKWTLKMQKLSTTTTTPTTTTTTTTTTTSTTSTTTTISTTTKAATTKAAKSACGLNEWNLSEGELTGTSVTLDTPGGGGASAAVTVTTAHQFAKCTVHGDFEFSLYEVDTANGICSPTAVATGLWTTKKVFEDSPGVNATTTTARVTIAFSTTALAADLQKPKPQIYRKGSTAGKEILSFCVRSMIKVDGHVLKFSEMIVTTTINTVLAIPAIENTDVTRPKANVVTTETLLLTTVHAYECYKDGNTFKGYEGAPKPALTTQENILTVCVTGVAPALECKEFWDLSLKQGSKVDDVRVADGENKKSLVTSVFGVQAIENTKLGTSNHGCVAQLLLDSSYFDSAKPEKVTLSGSVRVGLAARRRLLRDERSLSDDHNTKTTKFGVDVDRLQGSTSVVSGGGVATTALTTTVLSILAASVSM